MSDHDVQREISEIFRDESRRIFASLVGLIGDFDLAEAALQDAFAAAVEQWPTGGVPEKPRAWLVSTARFKAIDAIRRRVRFDRSATELANYLESASADIPDLDETRLKDDQLRLIFTCCHPALAPDTRVALTLREVCGLTTEEIASAFLASTPTIAQRIVRGKNKIRVAKIPYAVPGLRELPDRLDSVLSVTYLVFNEGYSASSGKHALRWDLSEEAIRLARILRALLPEGEVTGLLALLLLQNSRRYARTDMAGDIVLLEDQDRSRWVANEITEGQQLVREALASPRIGTYTVQAAIASVHSAAIRAADTDWSEIVRWYELLMQIQPSPVIALNRAVAVAMRDGASAGLELFPSLHQSGYLENYHLLYAAEADLHRRLGEVDRARACYQRALELASQEPERRFLRKRLEELQ